MTHDKKPRLAIGMPVFNSEKYIREAIDSILVQTYSDFELVISDNASSDRTVQICQEYAAKDRRIRFYRNEENIGAPKNFNRVFELSSSEYFMWAAYDDVFAPKYLQKCIDVLDNDPSVVLCYSRTNCIDENGLLIGNYDQRTQERISSMKPHERFGDIISMRFLCCALFGVLRASSLRKTPLHGSYIGADRNLLAEFGLMGRIIQIPEHLFFSRDHPEAYTRKFYENKFVASVDEYAEQMAWWSKDDWTDFPNWKNCAELFRSVNRVPLEWPERLECYNEIFRWLIKEGWGFLSGDIENLFMRHSRFARKLIPVFKLNLSRTVIPIVKKLRLKN